MNFTRLQWLWAQFRRQLIYRAIIIGVLSIVAALAGLLLDGYVPEAWAIKLGSSAVDSLLSIIASSMLAVTTFSLSTVVAAYGSATSTATPRATNLLLDDTVSQNMLATFIGAFIYSIAGIVLLKAGAYGTAGRLVLFVVTIFVIALIVVMLIRWIDFLMRFGRLGNVLDRIENEAEDAMQALRERPFLGGTAYDGDPKRKPPGTHEITSQDTGYVQFIDMSALQEAAGEDGGITVAVLPGTFVHPDARLAYARSKPDDETTRDIRNAFIVGSRRSFDQDPRLALISLSEVASRALSPGINDPGTAIEVLARQVRVFVSLDQGEKKHEPEFPNVRVPRVSLDELFDDAFMAIGRDGAGTLEVVVRMVKSLAAIGRSCGDDFADNAWRHMGMVFDRAMLAMTSAHDKAVVAKVCEEAGLELSSARKKAAGIN
jgi:uncharacterized membrane protein